MVININKRIIEKDGRMKNNKEKIKGRPTDKAGRSSSSLVV